MNFFIELPDFDFLIEIEINAASTMVKDEVRKLIGMLSFPKSFFHAAEITDVDITTGKNDTVIFNLWWWKNVQFFKVQNAP